MAEIEIGSRENIFLILNPFCPIGKQKRKLRDWLWKFLFSQRKLSLSILSYKVQSIIKTVTSSNPAEVMFAINLLKLFIGGLPLHFYCESQLSQGAVFKGPYPVISYIWLSGTYSSIDTFVLLGTFLIYSVNRSMFHPLQKYLLEVHRNLRIISLTLKFK